MNLNADLKEFLGLLNSRGVDYVIVGAHCLAFHGRPRYTADLDILISPTPDNAAKIAKLVVAFGFEEVSEEDFLERDQLIQLGRAPYRIDLLTGLLGVETKEALATKVHATLEDIPVPMLSKRLLIKNKAAVGRPQDLADLETLKDQ